MVWVVLSCVLCALALISSCATARPGQEESSLILLPDELPAFSNVLVHRGWRVGIPDDWLFHPQTGNQADSATVLFADNGATIHGALELLSFDTDTTGVTVTQLLADLDHVAASRSTRIRTSRAVGPVVPETRDPLALLVREEYNGATLQGVTVVATSAAADGSDTPPPITSGVDAVIVRVHLEPSAVSLPAGFSDFASLAAAIISGVRPVGSQFDGRYHPSGLAFSTYGDQRWRWLSDIPGGFTVYGMTHDGRGLTAGVWRESPGVQTTRSVPQAYDQDFPGGTDIFVIGPAAVHLTHAALLRRGNFAGLGRALYLTGSFVHRNETWGLFLREQLSVEQEPGPMPSRDVLASPEIVDLFAVQISPRFNREMIP